MPTFGSVVLHPDRLAGAIHYYVVLRVQTPSHRNDNKYLLDSLRWTGLGKCIYTFQGTITVDRYLPLLQIRYFHTSLIALGVGKFKSP
jgi:hypothetical protein